MPERNERIIALAESGMMNSKIAKCVGIKKARVGQIIQEMGRLDLCGHSRRLIARPFKGGRPFGDTKCELPAQEKIREALLYDEVSGQFTWRFRNGLSARHNSRFSGKPAGSRNKAIHYVQICINSVPYYAHRLAWIYVHGVIPEGTEIDHINRIKWDNRIENLRAVSRSVNVLNR